MPSHDCGWVCRVNDCDLTDRDLGGYVMSMTVASLTVPYQSRDCVYNGYCRVDDCGFTDGTISVERLRLQLVPAYNDNPSSIQAFVVLHEK